VPPGDAAGYIVAQVIGAVVGISLASLALRELLAHPDVHYVTTRPGPQGPLVATLAEAAISATMMLVVLAAVGTHRLMRFAGALSASLVALFITLESPISGASLNPARSFGSAFGASEWRTLWVYLVGPPLGMLVAAELYRRLARDKVIVGSPVGCAKLAHDERPCRFCEYRWREVGRGRRAATTWHNSLGTISNAGSL
jgi:aquaporin Z